MTLRKTILGVLAISFAMICISLGVWQLRRLAARKKENAFLAQRRFAPEVPLDSLPKDTSASHFRRVRVSGSYDYNHEIIFTLRGRDGSPGINILTPVLRNRHDTAVLVNRGWIYSPDGVTADLNPWRESDTVNASGFVETFPTKGPFPPPNPARPTSFRRLDRARLAKVFPYPIADYYVVITDSSTSASAPPRVEPLPLDEGPHRNYAVQWFSFAAISIIGITVFIRRT
ncbi:MAG TPA: SURF1 family protein [Gemmatimonadaceae bacterium]|nr:SURF1 family protein [Gemmatimonadaceae bacterium]